MKVLVAMSGGVDSSVTAALLLQAGHDVTGVTMKLWGGDSDTGCCSVSDVDDARRVASSASITTCSTSVNRFDAAVRVRPYVAAHAAGRTPKPVHRGWQPSSSSSTKTPGLGDALGFDAIATGHHARIVERPDGSRRVARGADHAKDQSYVLYMLGQEQLRDTLLPVGDITKDAVRSMAAQLGLPTAVKPDSQDVCFITSRRDAPGSSSRVFSSRPVESSTATRESRSDASTRSNSSPSVSARVSAWPAAIVCRAT